MLDPHIRTSLLPVSGSPGKYSVTFRIPDRHGVFKFVLDYKRKGYANFINFTLALLMKIDLVAHRWSFLHNTITVPVVPPRHDGYPRFLSAAWPYYAGAISTSAGFVLFCALWLAGEDTDKRGSKGKGKLE